MTDEPKRVSQSSRYRLTSQLTREAEIIGSNELARRARVTFRQLDTWVRAGYLTPVIDTAGSGNPRGWHEWQVGEVCEIRETLRLHQHPRGLGGLQR